MAADTPNQETITLMVAGLRTLYKNTNNTRPDRRILWTWSRGVLARDKYTCQHCGRHWTQAEAATYQATGQPGKSVRLHAHHIKKWEDYPELRFILDNGTTLCHNCHAAEHKRLRGARSPAKKGQVNAGS